jgi:16S rRNA (uracil1498-N3)-methyltransferase
VQVRRFHLPEIPETGACVTLPVEEARHAAKVLRLRVGDGLVLLDGRGSRADAVVDTMDAGRRPEVLCRIVNRDAVAEPELKLRLYVAPPRGKTAALVLRAAVELGVWRITPILCQFGVAKPDGDKASWHAELVTAIKQSGNAFLPVLDTPLAFADALANADEPAVFGAVPRMAGAPPAPLPSSGELGVWIGPEGGFSEGEEDALYERGFLPLTVGRWILRVETAVPALLGHVLGQAGGRATET